jgi:thiol:disulfide interchange protein
MTRPSLAALLFALFAAAPAVAPMAAAAQTVTPAVVQNPSTRVELIAAAPAADGSRSVGIVLTPKPGWHSYWSNPGEAGFAPKAAWTLPAGATAAPLRFPVPGTLLVSGLMNYVYEAPATLVTTVSAPGPIGLRLNYLVCTVEICVPESATLTLPADAAPDPRVAAAIAALPAPLAGARFAVEHGRFALAVPVRDPASVTRAYFFPAADGAVDYASPQVVTVAADGLRIETKAGAAPATVGGDLRIERGAKVEGYALTASPGPVPSAGTALGAAAASSTLAVFASALLLAIAGGVVLNVMPCVFPILSLKALSLAKGGATPADARRDALAYAAGVTLVCVALGGVVLALSAAGDAVGWGFQLQNPRVVAGLLILVTAISLNLAGLFELGSFGGGEALAAKPGAAGSFWTGALAAFVATPCTGPFMAAALGAALVLPPVAGLLVFAGLGFGLAMPFLAIGFIPALRRALPRPGAWMATFRHLLSVPMFATALGLAWLLGRQAGVGGMALGLAGALAAGLALWWLGGRQRAFAPGWPPLAAALVASVLAVAAVTPGTAAPASDAPAGLAAAPFTEAKLAALQASHTPAFVYFTADWCLTCKVNERGALSDPAVAAAFKAHGVTTLVGDWTSNDPVLGRFIRAHNRAGVPLYLFYRADGRVETLPQVLTAAELTSLS